MIETDPLRRVRVLPFTAPPHAERCIVSVASAGYAYWLDGFLTSLRKYGHCDDALVCIFAVDADAECRAVIERHRALRIDCEPLARVDSQVKSVLYSAAHLIDAQRFLCLDIDMLVTGELHPLFAAIDEAPRTSIFACRDAYLPQDLTETLHRYYGGSAVDFGEDHFDFVINDGVLAAHRDALLAADAFMRAIPNAAEWADEPGPLVGRNQFLFNLHLARSGMGVELDPTWNLQLHCHDVDIRRDGASAQPLWHGRPVHILHFAGHLGKPKYDVLRPLFV